MMLVGARAAAAPAADPDERAVDATAASTADKKTNFHDAVVRGMTGGGVLIAGALRTVRRGQRTTTDHNPQPNRGISRDRGG